MHSAERPRAHPQWHLDEMYLAIGGRWMYLWRAIDQNGEALDNRVPLVETIERGQIMATKSLPKKKLSAKKAVAKKPAARKAVTKKAVARKPAARKTATKKAA